MLDDDYDADEDDDIFQGQFAALGDLHAHCPLVGFLRAFGELEASHSDLPPRFFG